MYQSHKIHVVDNSKRIAVENVKIANFVVKLKIHRYLPPKSSFRDETRQYLENLKSFRDGDIDLSGLVDEEHSVIFIRGIAGMGKTVLAKQLMFGWAKDELFQNFKLCIMFECRDLNYFRSTTGAMLERHEILGEYFKKKGFWELRVGECLLVIVDGLDELDDINMNNSIIADLLDINGKFSMSKIIVTGRPHVEHKLEGYNIDMGCLRKVEILGLSENQIQEYIEKFPSCFNTTSLITFPQSFSLKNIPILHVPQFLNTFCCITMLRGGEPISDQGELYCWTIYLLVKQHADKTNSVRKNIPQLFKEFAETILAIGKICHTLLSENKIIIEGSIQWGLGDNVHQHTFINSLFIDVSDDFSEKYQFKHLSLMEFLSALHICCDIQNCNMLLKDSFDKGFIEVASFVCRLLSGLSREGIIRELLKDVIGLECINVKQFLKTVVGLTMECKLDEAIKFGKSIEYITYFLNDIPRDKQFILSITRQLTCDELHQLTATEVDCIADICDFLENVCGCEKDEIRSSFENFTFINCTVQNLHSLTCMQYI